MKAKRGFILNTFRYLYAFTFIVPLYVVSICLYYPAKAAVALFDFFHRNGMKVFFERNSDL